MVSELYICTRKKIEDTKMCGNIPGFRFNPIAAQLCSRYDDGLNLMWNASMMKAQTMNMLTQLPTASGSIFSEIPWSMSGMNYLLDPRFTMMQFNQKFGGGMGFGGFGNFGGVGSNNGGGFFGNFDFGNFWGNIFGNKTNNNGSNGSNNTGSKDTVEQKQLKAVDKAIDKLKGTDAWTEDISSAYNEALKKETDKEKLEALKEVFESIDKNKLNEAILGDEEVSKLLEQSGYTKLKSDGEKSTDWKKLASTLADDLQTGKSDELGKVAGMIKSDSTKIMPFMSAWNDRKTNNLFRVIAAKIPSAASEKTIWKESAEAFAEALIDEAEKYSDYSSVKTKTKALKDALEKMSGSFTKANVEAIADKCNSLYAEVRVLNAQAADKYIQEHYGFMNDMKSDVIPDGAILKATQEDLKNENISVPDVALKDGEDDKTPTVEQTAEEKVNELVRNGKLVKRDNMTQKAKGVAVYCSKEKDSSGKYQYFIIRNNELVKVNGQVSNNGYLCDGSGKHISNLTDSDVSAFDESSLPAKTGNDLGKQRKVSKKGKNSSQNAIKTEAINLADKVRDKLVGDTSVSEGMDVIDIIDDDLNKDNIYYFLQRYIEKDGSGSADGRGGLCDQIDNEGDWSIFRSAFKDKTIKAEVIGKIVQYVLDWCESDSDVSNSNYYEKLNALKQKGDEELRANSETVDLYLARLIKAKEKAESKK